MSTKATDAQLFHNFERLVHMLEMQGSISSRALKNINDKVQGKQVDALMGLVAVQFGDTQHIYKVKDTYYLVRAPLPPTERAILKALLPSQLPSGHASVICPPTDVQPTPTMTDPQVFFSALMLVEDIIIALTVSETPTTLTLVAQTLASMQLEPYSVPTAQAETKEARWVLVLEYLRSAGALHFASGGAAASKQAGAVVSRTKLFPSQVPPEVVANRLNAGSHGRFTAEQVRDIRGKFVEAQRITPTQKDRDRLKIARNNAQEQNL